MYGVIKTSCEGILKLCRPTETASAKAKFKHAKNALSGSPLPIRAADTGRNPLPADIFSVNIEMPPSGRHAPAAPARIPVISSDAH